MVTRGFSKVSACALAAALSLSAACLSGCGGDKGGQEAYNASSGSAVLGQFQKQNADKAADESRDKKDVTVSGNNVSDKLSATRKARGEEE